MSDPWWNAPGNQVEYYWSEELCYGKYISKWLTIFIGEETKMPVGILITNWEQFKKQVE